MTKEQTEFKISNSYPAYMARYFEHLHPQYKGYFTMKETRNDDLKHEWWAWHKLNPHVYDLFEKQALRAIAQGKKKLSAKAITEWLRWEVQFSTTPLGLDGDWVEVKEDVAEKYR